MRLPLFQVDAFTSEPFVGNPAAVCFPTVGRPADWMAAVAREMNLSETAFLLPRGDDWDLRWFTPGGEVDLCGHATLASAHVLWETGRLAGDGQARFHTRSGLLTADREGDSIRLDFPATPQAPAEPPEILAAALGVEPVYVGWSEGEDWVCELDDEAAVRGLQPDFVKLRRLPGQGVIVTARSEADEHDFVSRYFVPKLDIDEDPVTGALHCCAAPFWAERLGRTEMTGYQASRRGGVVGVRVVGERVHLLGRAVLVLVGELLV